MPLANRCSEIFYIKICFFIDTHLLMIASKLFIFVYHLCFFAQFGTIYII